ncbi:MAG: serine hydrolase [Bryobacteraceae bacterium]
MKAILLLPVLVAPLAAQYFPPPDAEGGWRKPHSREEARRAAGVAPEKLDAALDFVQQTSKHGGLLVARRGWLVYERYFGKAHREAAPNSGSVGKAFTSLAVGILLRERADLFPDALEQKVFTSEYFPAEMFPLSDPNRADIKLGQLLAMTAGIRGNNPGYIHGQKTTLDPAGPDGWLAMRDTMAFGQEGGPLNTKSLWCAPGGGYSYASSSIHLASVMLRHMTGRELEDYVREKIGKPLGWGRFGWGYKNRLSHTAGAGGIALRPPDMLRAAYLLLHKGRWKDNQVVPADYVEKCSRPSPYNPHFPYSLQFNVNGTGWYAGLPRDAFWKTGSGGFCIFVVPSLDLVVYKMGGRDDQYAAENTRMPPVPESVFRYDGSREKWTGTASLPYEETYAETLRLVIAALL